MAIKKKNTKIKTGAVEQEQFSLKEYLASSAAKRASIENLMRPKEDRLKEQLEIKLTKSVGFKKLIKNHITLINKFTSKTLYANIRVRFDFSYYKEEIREYTGDFTEDAIKSVSLDNDHASIVLRKNKDALKYCKLFENKQNESLNKMIAFLKPLNINYDEAILIINDQLYAAL